MAQRNSTNLIRFPCALLGVTSPGRARSPVVVCTSISPAPPVAGCVGVLVPEAAFSASFAVQELNACTEDELAKTESSRGSWNLRQAIDRESALDSIWFLSLRDGVSARRVREKGGEGRAGVFELRRALRVRAKAYRD